MNNHFVNDDNTLEGAGYQPTVVDDRIGRALNAALLRLPMVPAAAQGERRVWLEAAIAAQIEMGTPPHAAIAASLESLRQRETATATAAKENAVPSRTGSARSSTIASLALLAPIWLAVTTGRLSDLWYAHFQTGLASQVLFYRLLILGVPLVSGLLVGASGLRRPVQGILNAIAIISIPAIVVPVVWADLSLVDLMRTGVAHQLSADIGTVLDAIPGLMGVVCWVPLAALGAGIGRRIASRLRRQPMSGIS